MSDSSAKEKGVLRHQMGGGPLGLGDPDDQSLRRVETEVVVPQKMKLKAKKGQCAGPVKIFGDCAKKTGLLMPFKCRKEAKELEVCLKAVYNDPKFVEDCTKEYLEERSEYRRTGIKLKMKKTEGVLS